jgi:hypothetical protein
MYTLSYLNWGIIKTLGILNMADTEDEFCSFLAPYIFFIWFSEAIGSATTPGLLCQPQVIVKMTVEKQMECRLAGETGVLG